MPNIAVQLYTVRDLMAEDFVGTLKKVADIGFKAVEFHDYGGMTASELRAVIDDLGLKALSSHVALTRLETDLPQVIEEAKTLGMEYIVCPWLPEDRRQTAADFAGLTESLKTIATACEQQGLTLAYHNHDFEFAKFDGEFVLDSLLKNTAAYGVQAELDVYWVAKAGQSPSEYIARYTNRCDLLHVKDASKTDGSFERVGSGTLDFESIFSTAVQAGVKWYIVEQDVCPGNPLDAIATSLAFVEKHV